VSLDRSLIADVRSLSDPELRRLVILAQDLLERRGAGRVPDGTKITYRREEVRCGKSNCTRCPHGPYWYAYWREDGKLRSKYLGSAKAREPHQPPPTQASSSPGEMPSGVETGEVHLPPPKQPSADR